MTQHAVAAFLAWCVAATVGREYDFVADGGALPDDNSLATAWRNGRALNASLAQLTPGDVLHVPNLTFHVMGGIVATGLQSVVLRFDGTIVYSSDMKEWPRSHLPWPQKTALACMQLVDANNVTLTSTSVGSFDGSGSTWWGIPGIGYLERVEDRPFLLHLVRPRGVLVEKLRLINSPYWTFYAPGSDGLEVRHVSIDNRRTSADSHTIVDLTAFNTDGFDVDGKNVWIHDCTVWNQDDSVCVKGGSDMLFERIEASGMGLTIGSIGDSTVRNITFRNITMHHTVKGIYLKFNQAASATKGLIEDVLYEDITMDAPTQWPIWIGPAQQSDSRDICAAHPCSLCWPEDPWAKCNAHGTFRNITLRRVTINNPKYSPGVLMGMAASPSANVTFDSVVVNQPAGGSGVHGKDYYVCEHLGGVALGGTSPVPPCFEDHTTA